MFALLQSRMVMDEVLSNYDFWVLSDDYCKKDPCNFKQKCSYQKLATHVQLLVKASRILYALLVEDFVHRVAQQLVNIWSIPRQPPIPWQVAGVFLAVVLWQHPSLGKFPFKSERRKRAV